MPTYSLMENNVSNTLHNSMLCCFQVCEEDKSAEVHIFCGPLALKSFIFETFHMAFLHALSFPFLCNIELFQM